MKKKELTIFKPDVTSELECLFVGEVKAGFPSPARDYIQNTIDLNKELIKHPGSTFLARVEGDSMFGEDIEDGDILIIDKSLEPMNGDVAVCFIDGEFTLKYIQIDRAKKEVILLPANDNFPSIQVTKENDFLIWGIVTYSIKHHRRRKK